MDNLATDTSSERETVATLKKTIVTIDDQLATKDIWDKSQEA
jgi:hypothetical protein